MKTKTIDVGRIVGKSTYELALEHGFIGTEEDFVNKETDAYTNMKDYSDEKIAEMYQAVASVTNMLTSPDLAEVITARGRFDSLPSRLDSGDQDISVILDRLRTVDGGGDLIQGARIDDSGNLIVSVKDVYDDYIYGNLELRKSASRIEWRSNGFLDWQPLVQLRELMPTITNVVINTLDPDAEASGTMSGVADEQTLTLNIPRGVDGLNGGQILDGEVNDKGELIITVANYDYVTVDPDGIINGVPILSIGEVQTVEYDQPAAATITGTPTNPILNLVLPKGKSTKIEHAYVGEDGFLVFSSESKEDGGDH